MRRRQRPCPHPHPHPHPHSNLSPNPDPNQVQAAAEDDGRAHGAARVCELAGSRRLPVWLRGARRACTWQPLDWRAHATTPWTTPTDNHGVRDGRGGGVAGGYRHGPNALADRGLPSSAGRTDVYARLDVWRETRLESCTAETRESVYKILK